ncbi:MULTISPECIES: cystathionine gamma-synthase family protein [Maricaulis]|jgi:methionine-gamma-lyase|uniref:Cystathionine gamma-synthase n=1 Tax=Maricaulis maris (strain MCS10) TaxID=394221 RepID=Q0ANI6_MARMM|nr:MULTISPECIES: cystathionine gamma-synthase family protein [Maricaulis]ABI66151.1 Cystathionine gamma-synthase [Maricaulis maris MCS10]MAC88531.1 methionine gamma-lyase [Maricaulis sp.]
MSKPDKPYRKREVGGHTLSPETQMMSYGYDPKLSEMSIKPPIFLTSTFAFATAEDGAAFFRVTLGQAEEGDPESAGLMYSRFNNPNMEVLEDRLALYDGADEAAVFSSGMAAISTTLMGLAHSGSVILQSTPLYGGTESLIRKFLPNYGIQSVDFFAGAREDELQAAAEAAMAKGEVSVIYTETPTNPTNDLVDLAACRRIADIIRDKQGKRPWIVVDNTFLGPVGQAPLALGADVVIYSLTKYIGGHSDLIAGSASGSSEAMALVRGLRGYLGTNLDAHTCWMLLRSLETVKIRMEAAALGARKVAEYLRDHPKVGRVRYLGFMEKGTRDGDVFHAQSTSAGSTFAFDLADEKAAFRMLNALQVMKLAVSLGGTETLICHPGSTTHRGVDPELRKRQGFSDGLVRISVGIENPDDLIADLEQALQHA